MDISCRAGNHLWHIDPGFSQISEVPCVSPGSAEPDELDTGLWSSLPVKLLLTFVRFFGVKCATHPFVRLKHRRCFAWISKSWQLYLLLISILVIIVDSFKSYESYLNRIKSFEFTALSISIYRLFFVTKNLFFVIKLFLLRKTAKRLFKAVHDICWPRGENMETTEIAQRKVRNFAAFLVGTGCVVLIVILLAFFESFREIITKKLTVGKFDCGWWCPIRFPVLGEFPLWLTFLFYSCSFTVAVGVDISPQLFTMLLIYPIGLRFKLFTRHLKETNGVADTPPRTARPSRSGSRLGVPWSDRSRVLRAQTVFHLEMSQLVLEMDEAFSTLFMLVYITDFLGFIATASMFIHNRNGSAHLNFDTEILPIFLALVAISVIFSLLRTGFGVWLSEQAHSVLPHLFELNLRVSSDEDTFLCTSFISRLQGSRVALTAGGFLYITREFVITILGVLLTYFLFLYQMQDQKMDISRWTKPEVDLYKPAFSKP
ncbi:hypothetical protein RvY_10658 [Ramazzottius varieornatus]|uniref:Gustatory receptor n=1 Tax=Ramazzottius varieornatus TaxID=947166 RepID=A0A1D1VIW0_RAMVA|nr:hypothetical protein RvY_10658 [Ramazzottius varieornatus]